MTRLSTLLNDCTIFLFPVFVTFSFRSVQSMVGSANSSAAYLQIN